MKRKFLFIVFLAVSLSTLLTAVLVFFFIERESVRSVDQQLHTMASSIFASGLSVEMMEDLDNVDEMLMEKLTEERLGRLIRIYSHQSHQLLYANETARYIYMPDTGAEGYSSYTSGEHQLRILTISNGNFTLQIALTLTPFIGRNTFFEREFFLVSIGLGLLIILVTFVALRNLLKPLRLLTDPIERMTTRLSFDLQISSAAAILKKEIEPWVSSSSTDEIQNLGRSLALFAGKLSQALEVWRGQYSVLAHELKTPLTIIRNNLVTLKTSSFSEAEKEKKIDEITKDVDQLSRLISDFLQWGNLASHRSIKEGLHANKINDVATQLIAQLNSVYQNRIQLKIDEGSDLRLVCRPEHLHQCLRNLVENACKYSPSDCKVAVEIKASSLVVRDHGAGLPTDVSQHLGHPFNRGINSTGTGLGLAWVKTICETYGWDLSSKHSSDGHEMKIDFNMEND